MIGRLLHWLWRWVDDLAAEPEQLPSPPPDQPRRPWSDFFGLPDDN